MAPAFLISFAVYSSVAFAASVMLIYHDITDKEHVWERAVVVLLELCRMGLSVVGLYAIMADLCLSRGVFLYDVVVLCSMQLFIGSNVRLVLFLGRLC
jgi:hypothetical protein